MIKQALHSSIWLGLLGGDWFYLSCGDPKFIAMGLIKLVLSSIGALLICYMFDWCIHLFNISKHPFSPKKYLLDYEPVFLGAAHDKWFSLLHFISYQAYFESLAPVRNL